MKYSRRSAIGTSVWMSLTLPWVAVTLLVTPAHAQQFVFGDPALLQDAMHGLVAKVIDPLSDHPLVVQDPCRLHLVNDRHASSPFNQDIQSQVNTALVNAFAESAHVEHCEVEVWDLQTGQPMSDVLSLLRSTEKNGLAMIVSYYPEPGGIMAFAKIEDTDGQLISSSGRYDLPVVPVAGTEEIAGPVAKAPTSGTPTILRLAGSSVIGQHLAPQLAEGFLKFLISPSDPDTVKVIVERNSDDPALVKVKLLGRPDAPVQGFEIVSHGYEPGSRSLLEGEADILMLAQLLDHKTVGAFTDAFGVDMHSLEAEHVIGIDDLEFIVNTENQLAVINREVIGEIYTNSINFWGKVPLKRSGLAGEISVVGSDDDKIENSLLNQTVLLGRPLMRDKSALTQAETTELVRNDPLAIGHVSKDFRGANRAIGINECGVIYEADDTSTHVERFEINTEDHPFARPVYLYVNPGVAHPMRDKFLDYVVSLEPGQGQDIVRRHFVDLGLHVSAKESSDWRYYTVGDQPAEIAENRDAFREFIHKAQRLSATFRFRNDSFGMVLNSRAERDLKHLVDYISDENITPEQLMLFGFADSVGPAEANAALARERAMAVASRLQIAGITLPEGNIQGIGEDAPIACNNLPNGDPDLRGRYKNRRVEVWIRN